MSERESLFPFPETDTIGVLYRYSDWPDDQPWAVWSYAHNDTEAVQALTFARSQKPRAIFTLAARHTTWSLRDGD